VESPDNQVYFKQTRNIKQSKKQKKKQKSCPGNRKIYPRQRRQKMLPPYTHLWETWKKSSIHSVCPWGQVRVKVLSPNPQLLRLGQLLAKPRGVVPNKYTKAFTLSTRKLNLGVYCFLQTIDHLTEININIHSPRYIYSQIYLHQKDT
jgi:hypothetical protein